MHAYSDAHAAFDQAGGYNWRVRVESILRGLGFCGHLIYEASTARDRSRGG
jgi:hypothetical protein